MGPLGHIFSPGLSLPCLEAIKTALDEEDNGIPNLFFRSLWIALINTCFFWKFASGFDQDPVFSAQELLSKPVLCGIWYRILQLMVLNLYLPCGRIWKNYKKSWMRCSHPSNISGNNSEGCQSGVFHGFSRWSKRFFKTLIGLEDEV